MTKQQKARAHLARAQELIQDTLAFGVGTKDSEVQSLYDKLPLSKIANSIDGAGSIRAFRAVNKTHNSITEEMLKERAKNDQFLIDALQQKEDFIASRLIYYRASTYQDPHINRDIMTDILGRRHVLASYGRIIELILEGALRIGRPIELILNLVLDSTAPTSQHGTIWLSITNIRKKNNSMFRTPTLLTEFDGKDDLGQEFDVELVHYEPTHIRYKVNKKNSSDWADYDGVLKLGPIPKTSPPKK